MPFTYRSLGGESRMSSAIQNPGRYYNPAEARRRSGRRPVVINDQDMRRRMRIVARALPDLKDSPQHLLALADQNVEDDVLHKQARQVRGWLTVTFQRDKLESWGNAKQAEVWGEIPEVTRHQLRRVGYRPPEEKESHGFGGILGGIGRELGISPTEYVTGSGQDIPVVGEALEAVTGGLNIASDAISFVGRPVMKGLEEVSDFTSHLYRAGRLAHERHPRGIIDSWTHPVRNFEEFQDAWDDSADGADVYRHSSLKKARAILADNDRFDLIRTVVSKGNAGLEEYARTFGKPDSQRYIDAYADAFDFLGKKEAKHAIEVLESGKISPGMDLVRGLDMDPTSEWGQRLAFAADFAYQWYTDPLLIAGKVAKGWRLTKSVEEMGRAAGVEKGFYNVGVDLAQFTEARRLEGVTYAQFRAGEFGRTSRTAAEYAAAGAPRHAAAQEMVDMVKAVNAETDVARSNDIIVGFVERHPQWAGSIDPLLEFDRELRSTSLIFRGVEEGVEHPNQIFNFYRDAAGIEALGRGAYGGATRIGIQLPEYGRRARALMPTKQAFRKTIDWAAHDALTGLGEIDDLTQARIAGRAVKLPEVPRGHIRLYQGRLGPGLAEAELPMPLDDMTTLQRENVLKARGDMFYASEEEARLALTNAGDLAQVVYVDVPRAIALAGRRKGRELLERKVFGRAVITDPEITAAAKPAGMESMVAGPWSGAPTWKKATGITSVGRFLQVATRQIPREPILALAGPDAPWTFRQILEMGADSRTAKQYLGAFVRAGNPAERRQIAAAAMDHIFYANGVYLTEDGRDMARKYLNGIDQAYAPGGADRMVRGGQVTTAGILPIAQHADGIGIPAFRDILAQSKRLSALRSMTGVVNAPAVDAFMGSYWKPAVLLRLGFIPRAAGEELLATVMRYPSLVQNRWGWVPLARKANEPIYLTKPLANVARFIDEHIPLFAMNNANAAPMEKFARYMESHFSLGDRLSSGVRSFAEHRADPEMLKVARRLADQSMPTVYQAYSRWVRQAGGQHLLEDPAGVLSADQIFHMPIIDPNAPFADIRRAFESADDTIKGHIQAYMANGKTKELRQLRIHAGQSGFNDPALAPFLEGSARGARRVRKDLIDAKAFYRSRGSTFVAYDPATNLPMYFHAVNSYAHDPVARAVAYPQNLVVDRASADVVYGLASPKVIRRRGWNVDENLLGANARRYLADFDGDGHDIIKGIRDSIARNGQRDEIVAALERADDPASAERIARVANATGSGELALLSQMWDSLPRGTKASFAANRQSVERFLENLGAQRFDHLDAAFGRLAADAADRGEDTTALQRSISNAREKLLADWADAEVAPKIWERTTRSDAWWGVDDRARARAMPGADGKIGDAIAEAFDQADDEFARLAEKVWGPQWGDRISRSGELFKADGAQAFAEMHGYDLAHGAAGPVAPIVSEGFQSLRQEEWSRLLDTIERGGDDAVDAANQLSRQLFVQAALDPRNVRYIREMERSRQTWDGQLVRLPLGEGEAALHWPVLNDPRQMDDVLGALTRARADGQLSGRANRFLDDALTRDRRTRDAHAGVGMARQDVRGEAAGTALADWSSTDIGDVDSLVNELNAALASRGITTPLGVAQTRVDESILARRGPPGVPETGGKRIVPFADADSPFEFRMDARSLLNGRVIDRNDMGRQLMKDGSQAALPGVSQMDALNDWADRVIDTYNLTYRGKSGRVLHEVAVPSINRSWTKMDEVIHGVDTGDLPAAVLGPELYSPTRNPLKDMIRYGFDEVIGPWITRIAREPLFMKEFARHSTIADNLEPILRDPVIAKAVQPAMKRLGIVDNDEMRSLMTHLVHDLDPKALAKLKPEHLVQRYTERAESWFVENKGLSAPQIAEAGGTMSKGVLDEAQAMVNWYNQDRFVIEHINDVAMEGAFKSMLPYIDDHRIRSQFSEYIRNMSPFYFAEEQFLKRWARTLVHSPEAIVKAQLTMEGLRHSGIVQKNQFGEDVFVMPGSAEIQNLAAKTSELIFGAPVYIPVDIPLSGQVKYTLPGFENPGGVSFSPVVSVPLDLAARRIPALTDFKNNVLGPRGAYRTLPDQLFPTAVMRTYHALTLDTDQFITAQMTAIKYLEAHGHGLPEDATAEEKAIFKERVENNAQLTLLMRAVLGFASPVTPTPMDPDDMNPEFVQLMRNVGAQKAVEHWIKRYPDKMAYAVFATEAPSGAVLPATQAVDDALKNDGEFFAAYDKAGPWLLPQPDSSDENVFNSSAYRREMALGIRQRKDPFAEWYRDLKFQEAAPVYFENSEDYEREREKAKSPAERSRLKEAWDRFKDRYFKEHPIFAEELQSPEAKVRRQTTIEQMKQALYDPRRPQYLDHAAEITDIIESWERLDSKLRQTRWDQSAAADDWRKMQKRDFFDWGVRYSKAHPKVRNFWRIVIEPELGMRSN